MINQCTIAVAAAFETPPFMVGASDTDTKYSNTTARTQAMYRQAYSPKLTKMKRTFSQACGSEVKARDDKLQRGDFPQMVTNGVAMVGSGIMTPNEVRQQWFDLPEVDGGDELRVSANPTSGEQDRRGEFPTDDGNPATPSGSE